MPLVPGEFVPSLLDSLPDGIVTIDASGRINGYNRAAERLFGYRPEEILGQDVTALIPLPYRRGHDVQFGHYLRTGEASVLGRRQRVEARHKDGTTFYCELTITEFAAGGERGFAGLVRELGERERTLLARGEARLRHIIDSLSALVAVYSTDGVMLDVNEAALRAGGVSRGDALGRRIDQTPWVAHSPGEGARALDMVRRAAAGETVRGELEIRIADGSIRVLDVILGPLRDPSGAIVEVLTSGIDVTDRRRAEVEVQHRLRQQEAVARLGALALKESDLPPLLTTAVDLTRDVLGADCCTVALEIGPGMRPATVRDGSGVRSLAAVIEGRRGPYGVLAADAQPPHRFREDDRHFLQSIANVLADVVRGVQTEEQLAHERAFSETAFESLPGLIVVADERGRMVRWNQAMERTTGYDREELARLGPIGVIAPDEQALVLARFQDIFEQGHSTVEAHLQTRDGRRIPMLFSARRITVQGTPHMLGVALDISDRRRLEEQLRHSQKMEALGQLAGGVAHDFNNLLTVIIGFSGLTLATLPPGDPNRANIEAVTEAANSAAALTRQLLAFSRRTMMEPVVLDLNAVVGDMETMLRRLIGEDVQLTTDLAADVPNVRGDVGLVTQVLMNLAVNARDAMPLGGSLTIATRRLDPGPGQRGAAGHGAAGAEALLIIRDTGTGMTPEVRERAFEPFFTTKSVGRGSGLGLAVVHGIVEQSGARIDLESEPGVGTTFTIAFPGVDEPLPAAPAPIGTTPVGSETILLVEDEDGVRRLARTILEQQGYQVVEAASGEDAVRMMDRYTGPLDLVVTDVVMPGIDGRDVADAVRAQFPAAKVLYLSGYTSDAVVRHGILHHEVAFLQKPFSATGLAAKVREVLSDG